MHLPRIGIAVLALLSVTIETPLSLNLTTLLGVPQVLAQTPANRKAEADRLLEQGHAQAQVKRPQAALQFYQQALTIYREIKDRQGESKALERLGETYFFFENYAKAIEYDEQSLPLIRQAKYRQQEVRILIRLGFSYRSLGKFVQAGEYYEQALPIAREINDRSREEAVLSGLGFTYRSLGKFTQAIQYYEQALPIARALNERISEWAILSSLGEVYRALEDYAKAIEFYQQSLPIAQELNIPLVEHLMLSQIGHAYSSLGDYTKALEYFQRALTVAKKSNNRFNEGISLGSLGGAYIQLADPFNGIDYTEKSLAIFRELKNRQWERIALGDLAGHYNALGDYAKAIDYGEQSLAIDQELNDRQGQSAALHNLGLAYYRSGDYAKAIHYIEQFLALIRELKNDEPTGALDSQRDELLLALVQQPKNRKKDEATALNSLGFIYFGLKDYAKVIHYAEQSLAIAREIKDPESEYIALQNIGATLYKSGNLAAAETTLIEAMKVIESSRDRLTYNDAFRMTFIENQARTYRLLQKVFIGQNKPDAALEMSERGKARAFVELLSRRLSPNSTEQVAITPPTISQLKQIAKAQNATLVQYSIVDDEFSIEGKPSVQQSELYIWVIKPTGEITFRSVDLKSLRQYQTLYRGYVSLQALVESSRQSIGVRGRGRASVEIVQTPGADEKQRLQELHNVVIKPIADLLPTEPEAHVIFIPHIELFLVPFAALQDEEGKYLIEKHTILTAPSIQVLELIRQKRERLGEQRLAPLQSKNTLIAGNPTMPSISLNVGQPKEQLASLPGAKQEAEEIAQLFNTQPLIGPLATETTIKSQLPKADIIHLATHGLLDYGQLQGQFRQGVQGAIALAPDGKEDGLLTSNEILDLNLKASLVVLSACDTGRGRIGSDGVIGLSRAFISAGTPSIIVSLWSVPDAPTADLMKEFYLQLQQNPDKAKALRQAMLSIMKQRPHPKDWAAFTLIGEAE